MDHSPSGATPRVTSRAPDPKWDVTIRRTWKYIVIHHSATDSGSAASFDRSHRKRGWDGLGYHFVIGNGRGTGDGVVEVGYRWTRQVTGAHAGRPRPDVNLLNEQVYMIYDPVTKTGVQLNGSNDAYITPGRRLQLGLRVSF